MAATRADGPEDDGVPAVPEVGTLAVDVGADQGNGRTGVVMDHIGRYVQMRPEEGGLEWDALPENVRPLSANESLSTRVAAANARSRERL
jgi:hypothetical protein